MPQANEKFDVLKKYRNNWVEQDFLTGILKNSSGRIRRETDPTKRRNNGGEAVRAFRQGNIHSLTMSTITANADGSHLVTRRTRRLPIRRRVVEYGLLRHQSYIRAGGVGDGVIDMSTA